MTSFSVMSAKCLDNCSSYLTDIILISSASIAGEKCYTLA